MMMSKERKLDMPRERLLIKGPYALSDEELLSILLGTGTKEMSVLDLSRSIIDKYEGLTSMKNTNIDELLQIKGIKLAKASTIIAAIELGNRLSKRVVSTKDKISTSLDVYNLLRYEVEDLEQENFIGLYMNIKGEVIRKETIFVGTINQTIIHPREIFKYAIRINAAAVIFVHNHPTGDSYPSKADIKTTDMIVKAGEIVGIEVVDHIIIGKNEFYSILHKKLTKI